MSEEKIVDEELFPEDFDFEIPNGFWVHQEMWELEKWPFYQENITLFYRDQEIYIYYDSNPFTLPDQIREFQEKMIEFLAKERGWQWLVYVVLEQYGISKDYNKSNCFAQLERIKVLPKDFKIVKASDEAGILDLDSVRTLDYSNEPYLLLYKERGIKIFSEENFEKSDFDWFPRIITKTLSTSMGPNWLISNIVKHQNSRYFLKF